MSLYFLKPYTVLAVNQPLVSILVPVHRPVDQPFLSCIDSIRRQDYCNFEVCFLLNGKPYRFFCPHVDTINDALNYACTFDIYHSELACSPGEARNILAFMATGDLLLMLDSDDIANESLVSKKVDIMISRNVSIVFSNAVEFNSSDPRSLICFRDYFKLHSSPISNSSVACAFANIFPNSGTLIRKSIWKSSGFVDLPHEDFIFFWTSVFRRGHSYATSQDYLVYYCISNSSTTGNKIVSRLWHARAISFLMDWPDWFSYFMTFIGSILLLFVRLLYFYRPGCRD